MTPRERALLVELVAGAWRPRGPGGGLRVHPAWADLDERGRAEAAEVAAAMRRLEAALDDEGLSTTARAVLDRITGG